MTIPLFVIKLPAKAQRNEPNGKISPVLPFCALRLCHPHLFFYSSTTALTLVDFRFGLDFIEFLRPDKGFTFSGTARIHQIHLVTCKPSVQCQVSRQCLWYISSAMRKLSSVPVILLT